MAPDSVESVTIETNDGGIWRLGPTENVYLIAGLPERIVMESKGRRWEVHPGVPSDFVLRLCSGSDL